MSKIGSYPRSSIEAYALVTFISGVASLFAWSFGLIVGGIISNICSYWMHKKDINN